MDISERLKLIASFVKTSRTIADIGTDHGYIPIYLVKNGAVDSAIACDINKEPVRRAKNNVSMNHLSERIETRLGNGLTPVMKGETDGFVIAGMGGMLMVEILSRDKEKTCAAKELVLSPQSDLDAVRHFLHDNGFKITDEEMLFEDGIYYTVMRAEHGEEVYNNEAEYLFGRINIEKKSTVLKACLEHIMDKNNSVMEKLRKAATENSLGRLKEIEHYNSICQEAYKCL